jgi:hypothetical protein
MSHSAAGEVGCLAEAPRTQGHPNEPNTGLRPRLPDDVRDRFEAFKGAKRELMSVLKVLRRPPACLAQAELGLPLQAPHRRSAAAGTHLTECPSRASSGCTRRR